MGKTTDYILKKVIAFLGFLFGHFASVYKDLSKASDGIPFRELFNDFLNVLRSSGMFLVLNIGALLVFISLPQGKDILLIIVEEVGSQYNFGNLIFLLFGILLWAVVSEYGSRYAIYVTDNSGKSISDKRVHWRKAVEKAVAQVFLMLPFITVLTGLIINYINDNTSTGMAKYIGYGVPTACIYLLLTVVAQFYFDKDRRIKWRELLDKDKNGEEQNISSFRRLSILPTDELNWCNKLFGLYNNYVFAIRKPANFTEKIKGSLDIFCENFLAVKPEERDQFPQNKLMVSQESIVPESFQLKKNGFTDEKDEQGNSGSFGEYRWEYIIPRSFYKVLHKQLLTIVGVCSVIFLIICCLNVRFYTYIGTPALVVIAFACYSAFYLGLLFLDYCVLKYSKISARLILFIILVISSIINNDHPVRYNDAGVGFDARPSLKEHFNQWLAKYTKDSTQPYYQLKDSIGNVCNCPDYKCDSGLIKKPFYPVLFICAEGGASRTGAYVCSMLSLLQDSLYKCSRLEKCPLDFKKSIYAFSSVSGGSLGITLFNGMAYLTDKNDLLKDSSYSTLTKIFFHEDFLSPVIGKMFYGDIVNLFLPWHVSNFDRAVSIEKSWEDAYTKIINSDIKNVFSSNYLSYYDKEHTYPAQFINTTEVETGKQCWLTNIKPNDTEMVFAHERDLLNFKVKGGINVSTATNFSTRFPLISPGAALLDNDLRKYHYVDGGYVENTGVATMLEVLKSLKPLLTNKTDSIRIKPIVIVLKFNEDVGGKPSNINLGNELVEIVEGIYNTRGGRVAMANEELKRFLNQKDICGDLIVLPLSKSGDEVPLNWVFSKKSLDNIQTDVAKKWSNSKTNDLKKLVFIDTATYVKKSKIPFR